MKLGAVLYLQWKNMTDPNKQARLCPHNDVKSRLEGIRDLGCEL